MHRSPATPSRRPRHRRRGFALTVGLAIVVPAALAGCSSSDGGSDAAPASSTTAASPETTTAETACVSRMPGEVLTAEQAVVSFTPERVCPGYVTIAPGTPVTFRNDDDVAHAVTISAGNLPGGASVAEQSIEPGATWVQPFATAGMFSYATDAIPSFTGTVDVVIDPA